MCCVGRRPNTVLGLRSVNRVNIVMQHLRLRPHWVAGRYHCYRLNYRADYDEEMVWKLVQRHGGMISVESGCIDFWIAPEWEDILVMSFPDLVRVPSRDYY